MRRVVRKVVRETRRVVKQVVTLPKCVVDNIVSRLTRAKEKAEREKNNINRQLMQAQREKVSRPFIEPFSPLGNGQNLRENQPANDKKNFQPPSILSCVKKVLIIKS